VHRYERQMKQHREERGSYRPGDRRDIRDGWDGRDRRDGRQPREERLERRPRSPRSPRSPRQDTDHASAPKSAWPGPQNYQDMQAGRNPAAVAQMNPALASFNASQQTPQPHYAPVQTPPPTGWVSGGFMAPQQPPQAGYPSR